MNYTIYFTLNLIPLSFESEFHYMYTHYSIFSPAINDCSVIAVLLSACQIPFLVYLLKPDSDKINKNYGIVRL